MRCPLAIAQERKAARPDRDGLDLDVPWWHTVHEHEYDLEVDTSDRESMREGADRAVARFLEL